MKLFILLGILFIGTPSFANYWVKLPVTFESEHHPMISDDCYTTRHYPVSFPGALNLKVQVSKADYTAHDTTLTVTAPGFSQNIPGTAPTQTYTYTVPGSTLMVNFDCYRSVGGYGYLMDGIFAEIAE
jgi:hypothetical protein